MEAEISVSGTLFIRLGVRQTLLKTFLYLSSALALFIAESLALFSYCLALLLCTSCPRERLQARPAVPQSLVTASAGLWMATTLAVGRHLSTAFDQGVVTGMKQRLVRAFIFYFA